MLRWAGMKRELLSPRGKIAQMSYGHVYKKHCLYRAGVAGGVNSQRDRSKQRPTIFKA